MNPVGLHKRLSRSCVDRLAHEQARL